jgi:hypothetical protein
VAGGGVNLMTFTHGPGQVEDIWGRTLTDVWDVAIISGTYPTNGYTLDPALLGQLNRFKAVTEAYFSSKTASTLAIYWDYDVTNKSFRGFQDGAGAGALTELTGTVGPFSLRIRVLGF